MNKEKLELLEKLMNSEILNSKHRLVISEIFSYIKDLEDKCDELEKDIDELKNSGKRRKIYGSMPTIHNEKDIMKNNILLLRKLKYNEILDVSYKHAVNEGLSCICKLEEKMDELENRFTGLTQGVSE